MLVRPLAVPPDGPVLRVAVYSLADGVARARGLSRALRFGLANQATGPFIRGAKDCAELLRNAVVH